MLSVEGLVHRYGNGPTSHLAINSLDFGVYPGELVTIVGPSGAGKTTLLRCLSGLMTPTEGQVSVEGVGVQGVPEGLAMVFQDYSRSLLPWLTVEANVAFPLVGKVDRTERELRVAEAILAVGLAGHEGRFPWQLSGGMQQRVAIARALAYRPRILVMDEPFASVDAQTRAGLEDLVLAIRRDFGMTILLVTHDIDECVYLGTRILVLSKPPAYLVENLVVELPEPRDQISSREQPEFIRLRSLVARLIREGGRVTAS